jgi:hypothetical protein
MKLVPRSQAFVEHDRGPDFERRKRKKKRRNQTRKRRRTRRKRKRTRRKRKRTRRKRKRRKRKTKRRKRKRRKRKRKTRRRTTKCSVEERTVLEVLFVSSRTKLQTPSHKWPCVMHRLGINGVLFSGTD